MVFAGPGGLAQLGERLDRTQEVSGSNPLSSTRLTNAPHRGVFHVRVGAVGTGARPPARAAPAGRTGASPVAAGPGISRTETAGDAPCGRPRPAPEGPRAHDLQAFCVYA